MISLRDFQTDSKCDCIMKYSADEARRLKTYGEIPESIEVGTGGEGDEQNDLVTFDDLSGNEGSAASKSEEEKSDGFDSDNIDDVIFFIFI